MKRNKSSKSEQSKFNNEIDIRKNKVSLSRIFLWYTIKSNKKIKKCSLKIQTILKSTEEENFVKILNLFNQKNTINKTKNTAPLAAFLSDIYLLYSDNLKLVDDFVPISKLNDIIVKKISSSNEIYVNDIGTKTFNEEKGTIPN